MITTILTGLPQAPAANYSTIILMFAVFAVAYFFMIRPQQKKQKEVAKWRDSLQKGDKVMTAGGVYAQVKSTEGSILVVEIARGIEIRVEKAFVMRDPSDSVQK